MVPVDQVTACMDVSALCCGAKGVPSDKMQRIIILSLREDRLRGNIRSFMHWPTAVMLADRLTKVCSSQTLHTRTIVVLLHLTDISHRASRRKTH